jgi:hypothetical protein
MLLLTSYLAVGTILTQLGGCLTLGTTFGTASFDISLLLDDQGRFLGVFAVCGTPNLLVIQEGQEIGEVINTEDDLVFGCPISGVVVTQTGGGGAGGGGT